MKRSIRFILIFLGYQLLATLPIAFITAIYSVINHTNNLELDSNFLSVAILLANILTIWHFVHFKYVKIEKKTFSLISFKVTFLTFIMSLAAIILLGWLGDVMQLPDIMKNAFEQMNNAVGIIVIALIGPIAEEFVFRGGIERQLLKKWKNPKWGILVSALLFGLIHGNPAQIPFAFMIGIVLGWLYYRSGSLLLVILIHVINNSLSVWISHLYPEETTLIDLIGYPHIYIVIISAIICLFFSVWKLKQALPKPMIVKIESEQNL